MNPLSSLQLLPRPVLPAMASPAMTPTGQIPVHELEQILQDHPSVSSVSGAKSEVSFDGVLGRLVDDVNARQVAAAEAAGDLMAGRNVSLHETMIAAEEASISFQLMVEVRNKLLESYQELMRMQV